MRARKGLFMMTVGALAFTVAAYAVPRDRAAEGKGQVRSESSRLLTGDQAQLRDAVDGGVATGADPYAVMRPVAAGGTQTYPPGTVVDTAGRTITLQAGGTNVFIEGRFGGWGDGSANDDQTLKTTQLTIDSASFSSGSGCALQNAKTGDPEPCANNAACDTAYGPGDSATQCSAGSCEDAWQQSSRPDYCLAGEPTISSCSLATPDRTCGMTTLGGCNPDDAGECYNNHFLIHVPACAAGTYTLTMIPLGTFIQLCDNSTPPLAKMSPALIVIPTGSCCFNIPSGSCTPGLTATECNALGAPRLFRVNQACPADGGPACAECATAADCVDERGLCATYQCASNTCIRTNIPAYDPDGGSCCDPATGNVAVRADTDPCTTDTCSVDDAENLGVPSHSPAPDGTDCDDANACTFGDQCTAGACAGTPVLGTACTPGAVPDECAHGGETSAATCQADGTCNCQLAPDLILDVDNDANPNSCFAEGEKVTVTVTVGPTARPITGAQFLIAYDPTCLEFNSISPAGPPYTNEVFEEVNEVTGRIFYAVGVELGTPGISTGGPLAIVSFTKIGDCEQCVLCFTSENPRNTWLVDDTGQPVFVNPICSKEISATPDITLDTPGPGQIKVKVGCNSAQATVTWDEPTGSQTCGPVVLSCTGSHLQSGTVWGQDRVLHGGKFPIGDSNFCCTVVEDKCDEGLEECWTVTVNDDTALDIEIQLSPTMDTKPGGGITRCIEFEVFANCVQAPLLFCEDITFGGLFDLVGHFNGEVKIPSAVQPACIAARDKHHTLRSCFIFDHNGGDCVDGVLHAVFKQDPFFGGNWLVGGNLDAWKKDHPFSSVNVIDIIDFGMIASQWLATYQRCTGGPNDGLTCTTAAQCPGGVCEPSGDTPCEPDCHPDSANADINGDGFVDLLDFAFISMNFLDDSKECCCPGQAALEGTVARTEVSVRELFENGMGELAVADLNADGLVNVADMQALMQGVRPTTKPADRGGKDSGTRSINRR